MAKQTQTIVTVVDDFDGKEIDEGLAETFEFTWEGSDYVIDLRPANAEKIRKDMDKWTAAASKVTGRRGRPKSSGSTGTRAPSGSGRSKDELARIREWAQQNGHEVSPRGRIAAPILEAYDQAHAS